jgi:uncharacterized protein (TIGR02266 family)
VATDVERKYTGLSADEFALSNFESELATRERALHNKERAVDDRRRALAGREETLRVRARALLPKAKELDAAVDAEVKAAAAANTLEAPLAEVGRTERIAAINARRAALELRDSSLAAAEEALGNIESVLAEVEGLLRKREMALGAFAKDLERRAKEAAEQAERLRKEAERAELARKATAEQPAFQRATSTLENARTMPAIPKPPPTAEKTGADRRIHPRVQVELDVSLSSEHNFFTGFVQNISEGGLFIATHEYLDVGAELDLTFRLPDGHEVRTRSRVQWLRLYNPDATDSSPGMGVRFLDISQADQAAVMDFLRQREPIFYD